MAVPLTAPADLRPVLKKGCQLAPRSFRGVTSWVLEDPFSGRFFRLGADEAAFLRSMDGTRSLRELLTAEEPRGLDDASRQHVLGLALRAELVTGIPVEKPTAPPRRKTWNPLFIRVPLGNPDTFFRTLARWCEPLFHPLGVAAMAALVGVGIYEIAQDAVHFRESLRDVLSSANVPVLAAVFLLLKVVHECGHGIVCRRFGGRVPEVGVFFFFFAPLSYIDATSSWRFASRGERLLVSAAGMLAELVVAAIAAIVWAHTGQGFLHTLAANVVWTAAVITIFFNANPLMRFDGYFLLADSVEVPNLYQRAATAANRFVDRWLLGVAHPERDATPLLLYGLGCLVWRTLLMAGIALAAIYFLHGIGIVLAALTLGAYVAPLIARAGVLRQGLSAGKLRWLWWRPLLLVPLIALLFVPWQPAPALPGVVLYADLTPVRARCPGFLKELLVSPGTWVEKGQVLARLGNLEEQARTQQLVSDSRRSEAKALAYAQARMPGNQAAENVNADSLRKRAAEAKAFTDSLVIRAPASGIVLGERLQDSVGEFLQTGRELLAIGSFDAREVLAAIPQEEMERVDPAPGQTATVYLPGRATELKARLLRSESGATRQVREAALTALAGGPLDIRQHEADEDRGAEGQVVLVDPVRYIRLEILETPAPPLRQGEPCWVRLDGSPRGSIAGWLVKKWRAFLDNASHRAQSLEPIR